MRGARQNRVPIQPADIDEPVQIADPGQRVPTMFHFEALLSVSGDGRPAFRLFLWQAHHLPQEVGAGVIIYNQVF